MSGCYFSNDQKGKIATYNVPITRSQLNYRRCTTANSYTGTNMSVYTTVMPYQTIISDTVLYMLS